MSSSRRSLRRALVASNQIARDDEQDKAQQTLEVPADGGRDKKGGGMSSPKCRSAPLSPRSNSPPPIITFSRSSSPSVLDWLSEVVSSRRSPKTSRSNSPRASIVSSKESSDANDLFLSVSTPSGPQSRRASREDAPIPESALHEFILRACTLMALENPELRRRMEEKQQDLQLEKLQARLLTRKGSCVKEVEALHGPPAATVDSQTAEDEGVLRRLNDLRLRLGWLKKRSENHSVRPLPEEAQTWADDFHTLMSSKYGQSLFKAFLQREFSEENVEFWLAVEEYKNTRSGKLHAKASKIHSDYVAIQSPKEINLDSATRTQISASLDCPDKSLFDAAQKRVQTLMESDAYLRFLQSELYRELLNPETDSNEEFS